MNAAAHLRKCLYFCLSVMLLGGFIHFSVPHAAAQTQNPPMFRPSVNYPLTDSPDAVAIGDVNLDGKLDVVSVSDDRFNTLINLGNGTFSQATDLFVGHWGAVLVKLHDLNGDGTLEAVIAALQSDEVWVLANDGSGEFVFDYQTYAVGKDPYFVEVADFNVDGKPDLASANGGSHTVTILLNDGDGVFTQSGVYPAGLNPVWIAGGDYNQDGKMDLAIANVGGDSISLLMGNGDGTFQPKSDLLTGESPSSVACADLNGDHKLDLVVTNIDDQVDVLLGNGDGTFQAGVRYAVGDFPVALALADLNLDGNLDLVTANEFSDDVSVLLGVGDGRFGQKVSISVGSRPYSVAIGDLNKDGKADLATANRLSNNVSVLLSMRDIIAEGETVVVTMDEDFSPEPFLLTLHALDELAPMWSIFSPPAHGSASVGSDGNVIYTPTPDHNGSDLFQVVAQTGTDVDTVTVQVTIRPRNDAPEYTEAPALVGPAKYGLPITATPGVWNDKRDRKPGNLTYTYQWQKAVKVYGPTWSDISGANGLTYTPKEEDWGRYLRFVVRVSDDGEGLPATMDSQFITQPVEVTNTAPVITEGDVLNVAASPVQLHATDADGNPLSWSIYTYYDAPSHGTVNVDNTGLVTYQLYPNCTGMDEFTVKVSDGAAFDSIVVRPPVGNCRFYVDDTATGANNGSTWQDAYTSLQQALAEAASGDEIWVAVGVYYPTSGTDRAASFVLKPDVAIYGSFRGDETDVSQRNWREYISILSGNIGSPSTTADNSYHVVTGSNLTATTVLDGLLIGGGNANSSSHPANWGGGMLNYPNSSPTLRNLIFTENSATFGGGMMNASGSSPTLWQVEFTNNTGGSGAGMENYESSNPTLTEVKFWDNSATMKGGGMENYRSIPVMTDVLFYCNTAGSGGAISGDASKAMLVNAQFLGNTARADGGALYNSHSSDITMVNAVFYGNSAAEKGGAVSNFYSKPTLINISFYLNEAATGGAIFNGLNSTAYVRNSILWNDQAQTYPEANFAIFDHSIVQGIANNPETGVYGDAEHNPRYAAPDSGEFHLVVGSPAIDAGEISWLPNDWADLDDDGDTTEQLPLTLDRARRVNGSTVDLGAYEHSDFLPPLAEDDNISAFDEDSVAQTLDVLSNDTGIGLYISAVTQGSKGSVSIHSNTVIYTPNSNANGSDTFTYTVTDPNGLADTATVFITIRPVNDVPTISELHNAQIYAGAVYTVGFTVGDIETAAAGLEVTVKSTNESLVPPEYISVSGTGTSRTLLVTTAPGKIGQTTIIIEAADPDGGVQTEIFELIVIKKTLEKKFFLPIVTQ